MHEEVVGKGSGFDTDLSDDADPRINEERHHGHGEMASSGDGALVSVFLSECAPNLHSFPDYE
jgi:hypothetical protein